MTHYHPIYLYFVWKSLGISLKKSAMKRAGFLSKALKVGSFSHLLFVDDLVLFVKVNHVNCSTIRNVLDSFCARSRQSISESKSRVYFSPNIDVDTRESLCDILGFRSTPNLGKYPGLFLSF